MVLRGLGGRAGDQPQSVEEEAASGAGKGRRELLRCVLRVRGAYEREALPERGKLRGEVV